MIFMTRSIVEKLSRAFIAGTGSHIERTRSSPPVKRFASRLTLAGRVV